MLAELKYDDDGVVDFTIRRDPIKFRIDDDIFQAPPLIGGYVLRRLGSLHARLGDASALVGQDAQASDRMIQLVADIFQLLIGGAGGKRFAARLLSDGSPGDLDADPPVPPSPPVIGLTTQALPALYYLLERYGLRPTVPSSPSEAGSTDGETDIRNAGISSTAGVSLEESITTP